jgi:hypothetical protein
MPKHPIRRRNDPKHGLYTREATDHLHQMPQVLRMIAATAGAGTDAETAGNDLPPARPWGQWSQ